MDFLLNWDTSKIRRFRKLEVCDFQININLRVPTVITTEYNLIKTRVFQNQSNRMICGYKYFTCDHNACDVQYDHTEDSYYISHPWSLINVTYQIQLRWQRIVFVRRTGVNVRNYICFCLRKWISSLRTLYTHPKIGFNVGCPFDLFSI